MARKGSVIIIAPRYHTNMVGFTKALSKLGYKPNLFVQYLGKSENYSQIKPTEIKPSVLTHIFFFFGSIFKKRDNHFIISAFFPSISYLNRQYKSLKPGITFVKGMVSPLTLATMIVSRHNHSKTVFLWQVSSGQFQASRLLRFYLFLLRKVFHVDLIITPIDPKISVVGSKLAYVPFCIEPLDFPKKYFAGNKINILSIGKFIERKDHLSLLLAFESLAKKYPSLNLTIAGELSDKEYYQRVLDFIKEHKLAGRVKILLDQPHSRMVQLYKAHDIFVLPSYNEPASYSNLEAMACKLPVIVSDENGTKDYLRENYNGYVFKARDEKDLAKKIALLAGNKQRIVKFGSNSYQLAKKVYSVEANTKLLRNALRFL